MIGKLEEVPLREVWKHEEHGFSRWLAENLDALSNVLGINLVEAQREVRAGSFEVDLVAEDDESNRVIIENQLEATDHDHLGKVLTYLTNLDAKTAVWITKQPRPEHIRAIQWLNETTPDDIAFYLVKLTAIRIGDSSPAPLFTVIVAPSQTSKDFGKQKKDLAERHVLRLEFWTQLLALAKEKGNAQHASRSPSKDHWLTLKTEKGVQLNYKIWRAEESGVELYIDAGDKDKNKRIFDYFHMQKEQIEIAFGNSLLWERLDEKKASRIQFIIKKGGLNEEERWREIQETMISTMDKLSAATKPFLPLI